MAERVAVLDPSGQFGTVDAADAEAVVSAGGKVLTRAQLKERELDEAYSKKSLGDKITSVASMAGPIPMAARMAYRAIAGNTIAPTLPPEMQAYVHGVSEGMTGGLAEAGLHEAVRLVSGEKAAKEYAQTTVDASEAHEGFHLAGLGAGLIGGTVAAGPAAQLGKAKAFLPGAAISAIGNSVEQGAARLLANTASKGVIGRALATGGELAARGAAEGALINASNYLGDSMLQDHDLAAEKLFASVGSGALGGALSGAALGAAGSLAKSAVGGIASNVSRVLGKSGAAAAAEDVLTRAPKSSVEAVRESAYDRAWRALGGRKAFATEANRYLPNGTNDVGEALLRHGVIDTKSGIAEAARNGTSEALAARIEAPLATVGKRIGEITENSGAKVSAQKIVTAIDDVLAPLQKKAGFEGIASSIDSYRTSLLERLGISRVMADGSALTEEVARGLQPRDATGRYLTFGERQALEASLPATKLDRAGGVPLQELLEQRKALDELVYREGTPLNPSARIEELRAVRGKMEELVASAIDEASGKVPGALKSEYTQLKRDYQALRIAQKAATDAADRGAANRTFSLTDKIIGSAAGGASAVLGGGLLGLAAGEATAFASKMIRERGDAATAVLLHRASEMSAVKNLLGKFDSQLGRSAKGLLAAPKARPLPEKTPTDGVIPRAQKIMQQVAEARANPQAYAARITKETERLAAVAPKLASAYTATAIRASEFLASKMPATALPDPLNPGRKPRLTDADAARLVRYASYTDRPMLFFEEVERGKLTREGAETAAALMPKAFDELRMRTAQALADLQVRGVSPPYAQRERIGLLLGFPAVAAQRPEHMVFLQANVQQPADAGTMSSSSKAAPAPPKRPIQNKSQQSALDRLEGK